jgi:translation initiation factor 2B subunit (eIF-2B alpha/beta/delta family)
VTVKLTSRWLKSEINRIGDEAESTEDEVCPFLSPPRLLLFALYHHSSFPYPHPHLLSLASAPRSARGADCQQKEYLIKAIDSYIEVRIHLADQVIASTAREKIKAGYSVVTFARSSVVEQALMEAWDDIRENDPEASFSVVVVDSRPLNEGTFNLSSSFHHRHKYGSNTNHQD